MYSLSQVNRSQVNSNYSKGKMESVPFTSAFMHVIEPNVLTVSAVKIEILSINRKTIFLHT